MSFLSQIPDDSETNFVSPLSFQVQPQTPKTETASDPVNFAALNPVTDGMEEETEARMAYIVKDLRVKEMQGLIDLLELKRHHMEVFGDMLTESTMVTEYVTLQKLFADVKRAIMDDNLNGFAWYYEKPDGLF